MSETKHALLGASSAERWIHCPPSVVLTQDMPDTTSPYALEGTIAHALAELKVRKQFLTGVGPKRYATLSYAIKERLGDHIKALNGNLDALDTTWAEMDSCTDTYLDAVKEAFSAAGSYPYLALEQRVDFSRWVPEGFGTADCVIIGNGSLHIIDYKHGKGVQVEAEDNPQLMLYALGALERYIALYDIHTVRWSIVQPRNDGVSHAPETDKESLYQWAEDIVQPAAELAVKGEGAYAVGDWCRFCKAKATCRARSDHNLALDGFTQTKPALLTPEEISDILSRSRDLVSWLKDLEGHSLTELLNGQEIPGWKAVAGRAIRAWTDQEAAFRKALELGTPEAMLYERKPISLAQLEKTLGKKGFEPLADFVTVPPGKPTLAPESDKRAAISNRADAETDFA